MKRYVGHLKTSRWLQVWLVVCLATAAVVICTQVQPETLTVNGDRTIPIKDHFGKVVDLDHEAQVELLSLSPFTVYQGDSVVMAGENPQVSRLGLASSEYLAYRKLSPGQYRIEFDWGNTRPTMAVRGTAVLTLTKTTMGTIVLAIVVSGLLATIHLIAYAFAISPELGKEDFQRMLRDSAARSSAVRNGS